MGASARTVCTVPSVRLTGVSEQPLPNSPFSEWYRSGILSPLALGALAMTENRQLVFGHFRVASQPDGTPMELGRGAMGVTYKAFDERLRIDVALKLITPAQIDNAKAQASFLREARAAARVHHSNVASVVYLNDTPGNFFYAMEFVEGQPLREWMRAQHVVPPVTAIALAIQIARGLEAIHEQQLVHRDLKPANLMLVKSATKGGTARDESDPDSWRVKIIDFGLARAVAADGHGGVAPTQTAGFHGTALYASPEQCEERTDIDGRSDFYSLGCILWEMLCGTPPFRARTHRELMNQHVSEPLPLDRLAHVPPSLAAVVARLLLKDPVNRFPNAAALIKALERAREKIESGEEKTASPEDTTVDPAGVPASSGLPPPPSAGTPSPSSTIGGSRRDLFVAAAAVLALLVPGWMIFNGRKAGLEPARTLPTTEKSTVSVAPAGPSPTTATLKKWIAVLPFSNLSSDKGNEVFADGVHEDVINTLTMNSDLLVISRTSVQRYKVAADRNVREIARELGVGTVLEGSVRLDKNRVLVSVQLVDPETGQNLWADSYKRELRDMIEMQNEIGVAIASALQSNLADGMRSKMARLVAANPSAHALYVTARELLADLSDDGKIAAATAALNVVIKEDPSFALAHAQLSMLHSQVYDNAFERTPERLALARQSAETALRLDPNLPDAQLAMAIYYYRGSRNYAEALPYFQRALEARPGDSDILFEFAAMERRQGKWNDAAEKFERVAAMVPTDPLKQFNIANTYFFMRRYEDTWRILERALKRMPGSAPLKQLKGDLFLSWKNDLGPKREDVATRSPSSPDPDFYVSVRIELLLLERKFDEALAVLRNSKFTLAEGGSIYWTRDALEAEILTQAGQTAQAEPVWQRAVKDLAERLAAQPADARVRMAYARALAGSRQAPEEAAREARKAASDVSVQKDAMAGTFYQAGLALVCLRTGLTAEAVEIVQHLRKIPSIYPDWYFSLSPAWDTLPERQNSTPLKR